MIWWIAFVIGTDTFSANYRKNFCKGNIHYVVQTYYLTDNILREICVSKMLKVCLVIGRKDIAMEIDETEPKVMGDITNRHTLIHRFSYVYQS